MKSKNIITLVLLGLLGNTVFSQNSSLILGVGKVYSNSSLVDQYKNIYIKECFWGADIYFNKRISKINFLEIGIQYNRGTFEFENKDFFVDGFYFFNKHKITTQVDVLRFPLLIKSNIFSLRNTKFSISYGPSLEKFINNTATVYEGRLNRPVFETNLIQWNSFYGFQYPFILKLNISPIFKKIGIAYNFYGYSSIPIGYIKPRYAYRSSEMILISNFHFISLTFNFNDIFNKNEVKNN